EGQNRSHHSPSPSHCRSRIVSPLLPKFSQMHLLNFQVEYHFILLLSIFFSISAQIKIHSFQSSADGDKSISINDHRFTWPQFVFRLRSHCAIQFEIGSSTPICQVWNFVISEFLQTDNCRLIPYNL